MALVIKEESGFTILEVVIAVVVLAVGLMSAAAMQTRAIDEGNSAARLTERIAGAELVLEDIMNRVIVPSDPDLDGMFVDPDGDWHEMSTGSDHQTFQARYRITANSPVVNLTTIRTQAVPQGMTEYQREKKTVGFSYVRSTRYH